jgi:hypothetical protein
MCVADLLHSDWSPLFTCFRKYDNNYDVFNLLVPDASIIEIAEPFCPPDRPQPDPNPYSCQLFDFNVSLKLSKSHI